MKEKDLTIKNTNSLTIKKDKPKELTKKSQITALVKTSTKNTKKETKKNNIEAISSKTSKVNKSEGVTKETNKNTSKNKNISTKKTKKDNLSTKKINSYSNSKKTDIKSYAIEYFDLPYRYNETIVKLLVQTPKRLFVYWDISDKDRENLINLFGNNFFDETIPFLRVINENMNYYFDIEINDFANSWYININDDNCKYSIEMYRKFKINTINDEYKNLIQDLNKQNNNFNDENNIFISVSNKMDAPNNKIFSNEYTYPKTIEYKNIKTNMSSFKIIEKQSNIKFYNTFFKDEEINNIINPITNLPSSRF